MQYSSGFILGLSTGVVCLAYCGPVLIPYLMGEGKGIYKNIGSVSLFLLGRLAAYLLVGILTGMIGHVILQPSVTKTVFVGVLYIILSLLMIVYGFHRFREICLARSQLIDQKIHTRRWPFLLPLTGGFATGLNLCPPFLLAITGAMETGKVSSSALFFFLFFLGTSVYFIPLPFIGFFRKQQVLRIIGKFAAVFAGIIYLYKGIIMLI
ncbi:MAG: sulfite exporter TauE/SafE family protein [Bacteroidales bacterium]|nr:sulfite exporter TauE/SafE family protein [Bacteroidales bacterium]